jgi:hypothetical protein
MNISPFSMTIFQLPLLPFELTASFHRVGKVSQKNAYAEFSSVLEMKWKDVN